MLLVVMEAMIASAEIVTRFNLPVDSYVNVELSGEASCASGERVVEEIVVKLNDENNL